MCCKKFVLVLLKLETSAKSKVRKNSVSDFNYPLLYKDNQFYKQSYNVMFVINHLKKLWTGGQKDLFINVLKFIFWLNELRVEELQNIEIK